MIRRWKVYSLTLPSSAVSMDQDVRAATLLETADRKQSERGLPAIDMEIGASSVVAYRKAKTGLTHGNCSCPSRSIDLLPLAMTEDSERLLANQQTLIWVAISAVLARCCLGQLPKEEWRTWPDEEIWALNLRRL